jgi:hypothetical protein
MRLFTQLSEVTTPTLPFAHLSSAGINIARRCFMLLLLLLPLSRAASQAPPGPALFPPPNSHQDLPPLETLPTPTTPATESEIEFSPEINRIEEMPPRRFGFWLAPAPWDTSLELGLNGSSGTNESLSLRTGGNTKRESRYSKLTMSSYYNRTTRGGTATQDNATLDIRNDWLLDENSPWTLYGTGNVFYDQFQAFDLQTNVNTGVGYRFVHDPELEIIGRCGAGTSREFGGPDDRWVPESLFGFEYSQKLSSTQKFYGKLDYFPEWDEIGEYRLVADMGWEIALVEPANMSLKLSASDRFDSTPNGANPHLVNYSVLLLLRL